jgi:hypothetical protein
MKVILRVIGVCGVVGNLVARVLMDHGFNVNLYRHKIQVRMQVQIHIKGVYKKL